MNGFTLEPENEDKLSPFVQNQGTTYGPEYTDTKSNRFALVLGEQNPGPDVINNSIATGDQDRWSQILKMREDVANAQQRNSLIQEIASTRDPMAAPTPDEIGLVSTLTNDELYSSDLSTILEKKYSDLYTNTVSALEENVVARDAFEEDEEASLEVLDRVSVSQQRVMIAQDKLENMNKKWEQAGYFEKGVAFLKGVVPGYNWWKTMDRIEDAPTVSMLSGNNLGEQVAYLYTLPPTQFKETLDRAVDELAEDNLLVAQQFAQAVQSYSSYDAGMNNLFDVLDLADVATVGLTSVGKLAKGVSRASRGVKVNPKNLGEAAAQVGVYREATVQKVTQDATVGDVTGVQRFARTGPASVEERLPSLYAPQRAFTGESSLESASANRLRETIARSADLAKDFLNQGRLVDRLEPAQLQLAAREAFDRISDTFSNVNHHIIDTSFIPASSDTLTNTASVAVKMGKKDGTLFPSEWSANMFAKRYIALKSDDYTIEQDGVGGYFIQIQRPVSDVGSYRNLEIDLDIKAPESLSSTFLRNLRSPDYILGEANVEARGRVVHGQEFLADYMKKLTEPFAGKSKEWIDELEKVMVSNRVNRKYHETINDFEHAFLNANGKTPDEDQAAAYFAYVQLNDLDYLVRDADIVKQKIRLGGERISFKVTDEAGESSLKEFDGVVRDNLPYDSKSPYHVVEVTGGRQNFKKSSRFFGEKDRARFDELVANGYKIVLDPSDSVYYLIKDFKRDRIPLGTLNRVEGGHNEYRYSHFIKQGDINVGVDRVARYRGDKSLFVTTTEKQAREIAGLFEKARQLVNSKDPGARKFIDDNLPISYDEFIKKTKTGGIRLDTPIIATTRGQRTADIEDYTKSYEYFDDAVGSEHNVFGQVGGRYTTERADETLDVLQSENGVVMRTDLEPLLSPMETLRTSTGNMLDVRLVNDYKLKSMQDWTQQFGNLLDVHPNKVAANPMYYLQNPVYKRGANSDQIRVAENTRNAILQLQNYKNPQETAFHSFRDKLLSSVYDRKGEDFRAATEKMLFDAKDVQTFLRSAAFNMKLGFFNTKQLFLQASGAVNVVAISGVKNGAMGARAYPLMRMALATDNPDVLNGLYNKFGRLSGWEKDDFLNMVESYKQSGFATISGDVAYLDDFRPKTMSGGKLSKAWEHHTVFFTEGERVARSMAWAAAWREWKAANPTRPFDRFAETKILQRAKNLTMNMTRDSNASWQRGWSSVATQFMGYQARFMEQLWDGGLLKDGRKLSKEEKMKLVLGMNVMYGGPTLVSVYTGFPMRDYLKDWLAGQGVEYDDTLAEPFVDGFASSAWEVMTGNDMDISGAYGPNGLQIMLDLWNNEASWSDVLLGASGGVLMDTIPAGFQGMIDLFNPSEDSAFPVMINDLVQPLKNISTVSSLTKVYEAMNTQRYLSRSGNYVTDISTQEAITSALLGVNPDRVSDAYSQIAALKRSKESIQEYQLEVQRNLEKSIEAMRDGDVESARVYASRSHSAAIRGGLTMQEQVAARKRALDQEPMDKSVYENFEKYVLQRKQFQRAREEKQGG